MSTTPSMKLAPIHGGALKLNEPLPYSVFRHDGLILASAGTCIKDAGQLEILRLRGWRQVAADEQIADPSDDAAEQFIQSLDLPDSPIFRPLVPIGRANVLIADDMELSRAMLRQMLMGFGIKSAIFASDGREAVRQYFTHLPHLVFLDIDMPRLDGLSALELIRTRSPDVFVCLVSANGTRVNVQRAHNSKVDGFLVKPYTTLNLERVLTRYETRRTAAGGKA